FSDANPRSVHRNASLVVSHQNSCHFKMYKLQIRAHQGPDLFNPSLDVQGGVIDHKRGLQTTVLSTDEPNANRLSLEVQDAKRMLLIAGGGIQIREASQCGQHSAGRVEHLDLENVVSTGGGGLRSVDVQEEAQGCTGYRGRDGHRLGGAV